VSGLAPITAACGIERSLSVFVFRDWWGVFERYDADLHDLCKELRRADFPKVMISRANARASHSMKILHARTEIWLRTNRRALQLALILPGLAVVGCAVGRGSPCKMRRRRCWRWFLVAIAIGAGYLSLSLIWQMGQPRLAYRLGELLVYLGEREPIAVPIEVVEVFFLGRVPAICRRWRARSRRRRTSLCGSRNRRRTGSTGREAGARDVVPELYHPSRRLVRTDHQGRAPPAQWPTGGSAAGAESPRPGGGPRMTRLLVSVRSAAEARPH